jgi:hypothetical protein
MAAAPNKENVALAWLKRLWPLLLLLAGMAFVFAMGWHRYLTLQELVDRREALREAIAGHTVLAVLAFMAIYAATVALSLPQCSPPQPAPSSCSSSRVPPLARRSPHEPALGLRNCARAFRRMRSTTSCSCALFPSSRFGWSISPLHFLV